MKKNDLIAKLKAMPGNPEVVIEQGDNGSDAIFYNKNLKLEFKEATKGWMSPEGWMRWPARVMLTSPQQRGCSFEPVLSSSIPLEERKVVKTKSTPTPRRGRPH